MIPILNHLDCGIFEMSEYRLNFVPENKRPHLNVARSFIHKAVTGDVIVFCQLNLAQSCNCEKILP